MTFLLLTLAGTAVWGALLVHARLRPEARHWPPRRGNWGTAIWSWGLTAAVYWALFRTGTADWNPYDLAGWVRWVPGVALSALGSILHTAATADLGLAGTSGWDVGVHRRRSYALMRHPQYWGQSLTLVGYGIIAGSPAALVGAGAFCAAIWLAAHTEERFLARRHPDYARYRQQVSLWRWGRA